MTTIFKSFSDDDILSMCIAVEQCVYGGSASGETSPVPEKSQEEEKPEVSDDAIEEEDNDIVKIVKSQLKRRCLRF